MTSGIQFAFCPNSGIAANGALRQKQFYFIADARLGYDVGLWEVDLILTNLFDARSAVFGTFNENRDTGELERFLTPAAARTVKLAVRRKFGPGAATASR